jgi:hypothetical protein
MRVHTIPRATFRWGVLWLLQHPGRSLERRHSWKVEFFQRVACAGLPVWNTAAATHADKIHWHDSHEVIHKSQHIWWRLYKPVVVVGTLWICLDLSDNCQPREPLTDYLRYRENRKNHFRLVPALPALFRLLLTASTVGSLFASFPDTSIWSRFPIQVRWRWATDVLHISLVYTNGDQPSKRLQMRKS